MAPLFSVSPLPVLPASLTASRLGVSRLGAPPRSAPLLPEPSPPEEGLEDPPVAPEEPGCGAEVGCETGSGAPRL